MTSKTKAKAKDKEQSKRFIEKAREIGADETGEAFERAFETIVPSRHKKNIKRSQSSSEVDREAQKASVQSRSGRDRE